MLKIRLQKKGKKKRLFYNIIVVNTLTSQNGTPISIIGRFNPFKKYITIEKKLLSYYLESGCQPTNKVRHLIKKILKNF